MCQTLSTQGQRISEVRGEAGGSKWRAIGTKTVVPRESIVGKECSRKNPREDLQRCLQVSSGRKALHCSFLMEEHARCALQTQSTLRILSGYCQLRTAWSEEASRGPLWVEEAGQVQAGPLSGDRS